MRKILIAVAVIISVATTLSLTTADAAPTGRTQWVVHVRTCNDSQQCVNLFYRFASKQAALQEVSALADAGQPVEIWHV